MLTNCPGCFFEHQFSVANRVRKAALISSPGSSRRGQRGGCGVTSECSAIALARRQLDHSWDQSRGKKTDSRAEKRKDAVGSEQGVLSSFTPLALAFWDSINIEAADKVATRLGQSIKVGAKEPEEEYRKAQKPWSRRVRCSD